METNNHIESWYNQLKTAYLKRKQDRRVDRLIFISVSDTEEDYLQNIQRLVLNVGRMGSEERKRRTRQIKVDQINMERIPDIITLGGHLTQLFSNIKLQHGITVMENEMTNYTCNDSRYNNIAFPFKENIVSFEQVGSVIQVDIINIAAENRIVPTEHSSTSQDYLTTKMVNILAAYRSYRENSYRLILNFKLP
ncbi:uncharacterized protein RHIMIDRAFT_298429 [Rhizopus microsporus ATCC 52813]|uniref:Uncharacterized protein n=1 Tax=Rhizopus microsporus ATCC 52813 TaxID=1340429 RepID=A0A2G4SQG2_RHIZD|nr:uncharacterized protein RHIMIDRAFT_298429 [Rhizopus microsporus ATCC 52813]PHZ11018.1 hypothetical protein RHIMIDRAFT_298429 [Rhizopus microsporus ATCC 52813]